MGGSNNYSRRVVTRIDPKRCTITCTPRGYTNKSIIFTLLCGLTFYIYSVNKCESEKKSTMFQEIADFIETQIKRYNIVDDLIIPALESWVKHVVKHFG